MPRPKNSDFANSAIHGPHTSLPPRIQAKRRRWLADSREREAQYEALAQEGDAPAVGNTRGGAPVDDHTEALDLSARLQHQLEYGPRLAPHVPPKRVR